MLDVTCSRTLNGVVVIEAIFFLKYLVVEEEKMSAGVTIRADSTRKKRVYLGQNEAGKTITNVSQ